MNQRIPQVPRRAGVAGLIADQGDGQVVLHERHAEVGHHLGGRVEPVEHAHQRRVDVLGPPRPRGRRLAGQAEQVVALVQAEPQPARERREHLLGRLRAALLLEPRVVVGRHVREQRHLLAAQALGAAPFAGAEPDVLGLQRLAAAAQEVGQLRTIHHRLQYRGPRIADPGIVNPMLKHHRRPTRGRRLREERVLHTH